MRSFAIIASNLRKNTLKGFLALHGEEIKRTHDLIQLNKACQNYDDHFKAIQEECLMLTDYGVHLRYPFPMDILESDMVIAIKNAQTIRSYVLVRSKV